MNKFISSALQFTFFLLPLLTFNIYAINNSCKSAGFIPANMSSTPITPGVSKLYFNPPDNCGCGIGKNQAGFGQVCVPGFPMTAFLPGDRIIFGFLTLTILAVDGYDTSVPLTFQLENSTGGLLTNCPLLQKKFIIKASVLSDLPFYVNLPYVINTSKCKNVDRNKCGIPIDVLITGTPLSGAISSTVTFDPQQSGFFYITSNPYSCEKSIDDEESSFCQESGGILPISTSTSISVNNSLLGGKSVLYFGSQSCNCGFGTKQAKLKFSSCTSGAVTAALPSDRITFGFLRLIITNSTYPEAFKIQLESSNGQFLTSCPTPNKILFPTGAGPTEVVLPYLINPCLFPQCNKNEGIPIQVSVTGSPFGSAVGTSPGTITVDTSQSGFVYITSIPCKCENTVSSFHNPHFCEK